jgi:hypothetical protein
MLDARWSEIFAGLAITCNATANHGQATILTDQLLDQAMLVGVLNGLGLPLLSVEWLVQQA